ncbi:MAG: hypothetical protein QXV16_02050 [Candidatus Anstonellales archaeon]
MNSKFSNKVIEEASERIVKKLEYVISKENEGRILESEIDISKNREMIKSMFREILQQSKENAYRDYSRLISNDHKKFEDLYDGLMKELFINSDDHLRPNIRIGHDLMIFNLTYVFQLYLAKLEKNLPEYLIKTMELLKMINNVNSYMYSIISAYASRLDERKLDKINIFNGDEIVVLSFSMNFNKKYLELVTPGLFQTETINNKYLEENAKHINLTKLNNNSVISLSTATYDFLIKLARQIKRLENLELNQNTITYKYKNKQLKPLLALARHLAGLGDMAIRIKKLDDVTSQGILYMNFIGLDNPHSDNITA